MSGARGQEMGASVLKSDIDYMLFGRSRHGEAAVCLDARHLSAPRFYGIALLVSSSDDVSVSRGESGHDCRAFIRNK
jgi:hypothetical protein